MPKGYKLTQEQINDILNLHNDGLKDHEIASIHNIGRTTVGKILIEHGIHRNPRIETKVDAVMELFNQGKNQAEIVRELHMSNDNVRKILRENTEDITKNSWKHKYIVDETYFDCIDTPNKAYILGFLCADGNISKKGNEIKLFLQEKDIDILKNILKELKSNYPLHFYDYSNRPNHQNQYGFIITSKHMCKSLSELGVVPNKSLTLEYPNAILPDLQRHFLRGYFDGDGTIHASKNGKNVNFIGTYNFCLNAKEVIESYIDVNCCIYQYYDNGITSILQISGGKQIPKFLSWIYDDADLYLERKYLKYHEYFVA